MLVEAEKAKLASAPITKLVSSIIDGAIDSQASDIHIEPQEPDMRIRYRIDGILHDTISIPSSAQLEVISRIKLKAEMDISERRAPQDGHMTVERNEKEDGYLHRSILQEWSPIKVGEVVNKKKFTLFESVTLDGRELLTAAGRGLVLYKRRGL